MQVILVNKSSRNCQSFCVSSFFYAYYVYFVRYIFSFSLVQPVEIAAPAGHSFKVPAKAPGWCVRSPLPDILASRLPQELLRELAQWKAAASQPG